MNENLPSTLSTHTGGVVESHPAREWLGCITGVFALTSMTILVGCASIPADIQARSQRGYVYYLDGAGGGSALSNWSSGIREGLRNAGYPGWGEMFPWETGLGVAFDQVASDEYKRGKATELAHKIMRFRQDHPDAPITLIGFSAGSAVAVYTLESLPTSLIVENIVLLSGSLSADYDLTQALARVRQRMYIFTSDHDVILTVLVPISGPADRRAGAQSVIGVSGAIMPANPSPETESQYAKVIEVRWNPSFRSFANRGGHTDAVNEMFVRAFVAPLVFVAPTVQAGVSPAPGKVRNPDYRYRT
jgi:pimeloyl-ACP methyl ester carboxylesterase